MNFDEQIQHLRNLFVLLLGSIQIFCSGTQVSTTATTTNDRPSIQVESVQASEPPIQVRDVAWIRDPEVSWYGPGFYGNRTACGLAYTTSLRGVAHRSLPCGTLVEFRWEGRRAVVPVIDRGPYVAGRTWDLSGGLCTFLEHCFTGPIEWRLVNRTQLPNTDTGDSSD